jgi:hypothetical protein
MNIWQKIKLGTKFLFGSFESASDYLLSLLNDYLAKTSVAANVAKAREKIGYVFTWLVRLEPYCPKKWANDYHRILAAVEILFDALEDGKISAGELENMSGAVQLAYKEWQS